jgi:hypothetical protein
MSISCIRKAGIPAGFPDAVFLDGRIGMESR